MKTLRTHRAATAIFTLGLGLGCGAAPMAPPADVPGGSSEPVSEKQRIASTGTFDVFTCAPAAPALTGPLGPEVLTGLLIAARPLVLECLVDPANRGAAPETQVSIKSRVAAGKAEHAITGDNLTPAGATCIRGALDRFVTAVADWPAKAAAVTAEVSGEIQVKHVAGVSPAVTLGLNEGSDVAAAVRLAEPSFCECYAPWKSAAPRPLRARMKLVKGAAPEVTFDATNDAVADGVAACLQKKVAALPFKTTSLELTVPYTFLFVHSGYEGPLSASPPDVQFRQLDDRRGQRAAEAIVALGARTAAAGTYDALVQRYKAKAESALVPELKTKCAALLTMDDAWIATLEKELDADQKTLDLVKGFQANDPEWGPVVATAQSSVEASRKDIDEARKIKASDAAACPKEHY